MDEATEIFEAAWTFIGARDASVIQLTCASLALHCAVWGGIHAVDRVIRAAGQATDDLKAEPTGKRRKR